MEGGTQPRIDPDEALLDVAALAAEKRALQLREVQLTEELEELRSRLGSMRAAFNPRDRAPSTVAVFVVGLIFGAFAVPPFLVVLLR